MPAIKMTKGERDLFCRVISSIATRKIAGIDQHILEIVCNRLSTAKYAKRRRKDSF